MWPWYNMFCRWQYTYSTNVNLSVFFLAESLTASGLKRKRVMWRHNKNPDPMKYTSQICIKVSRSASCKQARPRVIYSRHTSFLAKAGQMINKCFPSIKLCWHLIGQTRNWFIKTLPGLWMNRGDVDGLTVAESRFIPLFSISFKQMLGLSIKGGRCLLMDGIIRWLPKTICFYSNIGEVEGSLR